MDDKRSFGRWRVTDVTGFEMSKKVEAELVLEADGLVLRRDDGHRDLFPYLEVFARIDDSTKTVLITATGRVWLQARGAARNDGLQEELTVRRKAADPAAAGPLEGRPVPSGNAPAPATLAAVGLCLFVIGLAIGVFQPLFVVGIGAGLVVGPTYAGLLFLLCIPIALVMLVLAFFGARWVTVPAFVGSAALAVGLLAGISTANALSSRSAASRPVTPTTARDDAVLPDLPRGARRRDAQPRPRFGLHVKPDDGRTGRHLRALVPFRTGLDRCPVGQRDGRRERGDLDAQRGALPREPQPDRLGDSTVYPRLVLQLREPSGSPSFSGADR